MCDSIRIVDKDEPDKKKSLAFILNGIAYTLEGEYSSFTEKVLVRAEAEGKHPIVITNWKELL